RRSTPGAYRAPATSPRERSRTRRSSTSSIAKAASPSPRPAVRHCSPSSLADSETEREGRDGGSVLAEVPLHECLGFPEAGKARAAPSLWLRRMMTVGQVSAALRERGTDVQRDEHLDDGPRNRPERRCAAGNGGRDLLPHGRAPRRCG